MYRRILQRAGRPVIVAAIAVGVLAIGATAGSLTPPGAVGSTMHSLANIYDSIASATFDSSGIAANQNGSLMGNLKYIEANMFTPSLPSSLSATVEITGDGTVDMLKLSESDSLKSYGMVVRDGDFFIRAPSVSSAFASRWNPLSIASNSLALTIGTPASPSLVASYTVPENARDAFVSGRYAYVGGDTYLKIIDISRPSSPSLIGTYTSSSVVDNVFVSGRYAYIANGRLEVIDVSNPANPVLTGFYGVGNISDVYVSGRYAYLASQGTGMQIVDISNPANPVLMSTYDTTAAGGIYVSGRYAYVADSDGLLVFDVSNPSAPALKGTAVSAAGVRVYVSGRYAYVAAVAAGLVIVDVSSPSAPTVVGSYVTPSDAVDVYVSGHYAYVADPGPPPPPTAHGLKIIDISNPAAPTSAGTYTTTEGLRSVFVSGRYAYVTDDAFPGHLKIIDIGGVETHALAAGNISTSDMMVGENADIGNNLNIRNGLNVGFGGLLVQGFSAFSSTSYFVGNVGIASSSPSEKLSVNGNIRVAGGSLWIGDGSGQFGKSPFGLFPSAIEVATTSHGGLYGSGGGISTVYVMLDSGLGGSGDVGRGGAFSAMSSDGNSALIALVEGVSGTATHMGSGTVTNLHGGYFFSSNYSLGTVATMDGVGTQLDNEGGGTVTNGSGVRVYAPFSSAFTNLFGLFIEAQTAGANSWNIYSDGASTRNYFGGNVGIGTTTPDFNLDVNGVLAASVSGNADLVLNNSQNHDGLFRIRSVGGAATSRLDIMGSASAALVSIASTGYVGIGTTAPITQLHVPGLTRPVIKSTTALTNSAKSVYVQGRYAYVTEIGTTGSLQIFDITNPVSPTVMASVSLGAQPYAITVQGQYAYVVDATQNNFRILNVSNPTRPTVVSTITTGTQPKAVVVQGRYAYVTSQTSNLLQVIDVANPSAPVIVGSVGIGNATNFGLAVQGRYAYIANTSAKTFQIVDVANPASPTVVRTVATTGTSPLGIAVEGRYAYVAETGGNEIEVFDVSDAANAFSVTTFSTGASSGPFSVFIQDHILYVVTNTSSTMQMIDISNPASPVSFGTISTTTGPWNIFVQGRYAYIGATQGKTFQIIDVGGAYIQQLEAGGLDISTLNVRGNSQMFNDMDIGGGLVIGRGLQVTGPVSFTSSISGAYNPFVFDATGNIGLGTTHVDAKLEIVSAVTTTNVASISALSLTSGDVFSMTVPASTSTSGRYLLVQDVNGQAYASLGNGGRLALRRDIFAHGSNLSCTTAGSGCIDYAESYPTTDNTLSAGEIVSVDPHNPAGIVRASSSASVLGVISTSPATLITGTAVLSGTNALQNPSGTVPVALAGRVPVKLKGSVSAGDRLSLSDIPGVAQKASTAGMTIGIALEDSSGPTVLTFVNTSYWVPTALTLSDMPAPSTVSASASAPQSDGLFTTIINWFRSILGITFEKGRVQADQLCAGTTCVDSAQLQRLLDLVGGSVPPATPTPSDTPSATLTPTPSGSSEPVMTESPSPTPPDTATPTPSATPVPTPSDAPSATPTPDSVPSDSPVATP